ncbi:MAG TPA: hypothetical protein VGQ11_08765 [Candidatus Acidoferrales bacterium]|jgi:hypothetical protein|nr:hypothetical protein [Candidatus Acidoferrales bacterium]
MTLEEAMLAVWRQSLEENANIVELGRRRYSVQRTKRRRLRQVDFELDGQSLRGIEQNPETSSRWAELARSGQKVMQFTASGRYIGNVADGKLTMYSGARVGPEKKHAKKAAKS